MYKIHVAAASTLLTGVTALIAYPPQLCPRHCHLHGSFGVPGIQLLFTLVVRTADISEHELLQYTINLIKHYTITVQLISVLY